MPLFPEDPTITDVIEAPALRAMLRKHLEKEFSTENLDFLDAVEQLKKACDSGEIGAEEVRESAKALADQFIKNSADTQVNLPSHAHNDFMKKLERVDEMEPSEVLAMFNQPAAEVQKLMATDSFNRFKLKDPGFNAAMGDIKASQGRLDRLEAKAEKLQTSKWEQFKAVFNGGTKKAMENIVAQIDKAKMEIQQKTDPAALDRLQRGKEQMIAKLERSQERLAPQVKQFEAVKGAVVSAALDDQGLLKLKPEERAEVNKLAGKAEGVLGAVKASEKIGQEKEALGKSLTVGESLKGQLGAPSQGQGGPRVR